uniref:Uncharacterized protein n=1 Tax=Lepeophtheirus salmonis TaxID=72036 RepID=A0A0K2UBB2_LEPSM
MDFFGSTASWQTNLGSGSNNILIPRMLYTPAEFLASLLPGI